MQAEKEGRKTKKAKNKDTKEEPRLKAASKSPLRESEAEAPAPPQPEPKEAGLDEEDVTTKFKLLDCSKTEHVVLKKGALFSNVVKTALEKDASAKELPTQHVSTETMTKIVAWMDYHVKVPPPKIDIPIPSNDLKAANYLDIPGLLALVTAKLATYIKDRTPAEIRAAFDIDEPTPDQEAEIEKQYKDIIG